MPENREMHLNQIIYPEMALEVGFIAQNLAGKLFCMDISNLKAQKMPRLGETAAKLP